MPTPERSPNTESPVPDCPNCEGRGWVFEAQVEGKDVPFDGKHPELGAGVNCPDCEGGISFDGPVVDVAFLGFPLDGFVEEELRRMAQAGLLTEAEVDAEMRRRIDGPARE